MKRSLRALLGGLLAGAALLAHAQPQALPEGVLAAEMAQDWQRAAARLQEALLVQPERRDWWLRLAQVLAADGQSIASAQAMVQAAEAGPPEAHLHAQASAALASADQPEAALEQIQRARALAPDDRSLLWREVQLANWAGQPDIATARLEQLWLAGDRDPRLGGQYGAQLARAGETEQARRVLQTHLRQQPNDAEALLLLARLESWRGNYHDATAALDRYHAAGGDTTVYRNEKAAMLGWADRPFAALALLAQGTTTAEPAPQRMVAEAIALRRSHRNAAAMARIDALQSARQDGVLDAEGLATYLTTDLRDQLEAHAVASRDTDDIGIWRNRLRGVWWPTAHLRTQAALDWDRHEVDTANGLEARSPAARPEALTLSAGIDGFAGPRWQWSILAGHVDIDQPQSQGLLIGQLGIGYRASDALQLRLSADRALHGVSPRAVDRGIGRNEVALSANWRPDMRWTVDARIATADFFANADCAVCSDDNRRQQWSVGAQRDLIYGQQWNLSLGPFVSMTRFDKDLDNGYYDPERFDNIALATNLYFGINLDTGLALSASLGMQRDHGLADRYTPAASLSTVTTLGIWADTMLQFRLAGSYGVSRNSDDYAAIQGGLSLVRRF
ncbi:tetratricopeptide repeat protein [Algiphilus sp.]|uniref:tetratricopeptide repeat protein n=1 Tax=Algiphilus sp. TaxID=1872431 RepID=UPI003B525414